VARQEQHEQEVDRLHADFASLGKRCVQAWRVCSWQHVFLPAPLSFPTHAPFSRAPHSEALYFPLTRPSPSFLLYSSFLNRRMARAGVEGLLFALPHLVVAISASPLPVLDPSPAPHHHCALGSSSTPRDAARRT
jgi:hypothetical protein